MLPPSRTNHYAVGVALVHGEVVGEREWRSWWWCWLCRGTTVVPRWFAGDARGGGGKLVVLWVSREAEGEEEKQRRERERGVGVSGSCPKINPPFYNFSFSLFLFQSHTN